MRRLVHTLIVSCALIIFWSSPASADTPRGGNNTLRGLQVADVDYLAAAETLLSCTDQKPIPSTCKGSWRGVDWLLSTKIWTAQIDLPSGVRWFASCSHDAIEREDTCSWTTGDEFVISRADGYSTTVSWGLRRFPGSAMEARFDNSSPISTSKNMWSAKQSTEIYCQMIRGKLLRYRWYSWPEEQQRGGELDLSGFANAAALMEALRDEFTNSRVLKKIATGR